MISDIVYLRKLISQFCTIAICSEGGGLFEIADSMLMGLVVTKKTVLDAPSIREIIESAEDTMN